MGWVIGYVIGGAVVLVVVVLLLLMIAGARKVGKQAEAILASLLEARDSTAGMWAIDATNEALDRTVYAARAARETLEGRPG